MKVKPTCIVCGHRTFACKCKNNEYDKQENTMKLQAKKIGQFLGGLNDAERRFLEHVLNLSNSIQSLIRNNEWLTKEVFCKMIAIEETEYEDFVSGNRNYDLMDISKINALHAECERRKLKPVVNVNTNVDK